MLKDNIKSVSAFVLCKKLYNLQDDFWTNQLIHGGHITLADTAPYIKDNWSSYVKAGLINYNSESTILELTEKARFIIMQFNIEKEYRTDIENKLENEMEAK